MTGDAPAKARKQPLQIRPEFLFPYDTRFVPLPVPAPDVCDAPQVQLCLNSTWAGHLDGLLERLLYRDAWTGTDDEIDRGIFQTTKILAMLGDIAMGCCCGNNFPTRINADGELEISYDGGTTWQPYPQGDPRQTATLMPPLPGDDGDEKKCQAAANVTENIKNEIDKTIADSGAWADLTGLIAALLGILIFIGVTVISGPLAPLAIGVAAGMLATGSAAANAAFTSDVYDIFNCILYCHISDDASFTDAAVEAIKSDIRDQLTGFAATHLQGVINLMGAKGLTNAARTTSSRSFDCDACDCPDFDCGAPEGILIGTVIDSGIDIDGRSYIVVQSVPDPLGGDFQYVSWGDVASPGSPPNPCCHIYGVGINSGALHTTEYYDCGGGYHGGNPETHDVSVANWFTASAGSTMEIRIVFGF